MQYVLIWVINILVVPLLALAAVHYLLGKRVWLTPVVVFLITAVEFLVQVKDYSPGYPLKEQLRLYFHNDVSMGITIQYVPMVIVALISTMLYYMIMKRSKTVKK